MIEPQSAQLGASAWVWKLTFVAPRFRVMADVPPPPFPLVDLPLLACPLPLVAMTASSSRGAAAAGDAATAVALGASESTDWASEAGGGAASEVSVLAPNVAVVSGVDVVEVSARDRDAGSGS